MSQNDVTGPQIQPLYSVHINLREVKITHFVLSLLAECKNLSPKNGIRNQLDDQETINPLRLAFHIFQITEFL